MADAAPSDAVIPSSDNTDDIQDHVKIPGGEQTPLPADPAEGL
jgi:hypothetical protein